MPDPRLDKLAELYHPVKVTPAVIEFVDIAGLVKGASKGEGLGNKFLSNIREVDAIVHVVRCFENDDIVHVEGSIDPARDIETINLELILSDIEMLDRRMDKTLKMIKADKKYQGEYDFFQRVKDTLNQGRPARSVECNEEEGEWLSSVALLTNKPIIYAANMSEDDFKNGIEGNPYYKVVADIAALSTPRAADLRGNRGGDRRNGAGGKGTVPQRYGADGVRPGPADPGLLFFTGTDFLSDRRTAGGSGLDH